MASVHLRAACAEQKNSLPRACMFAERCLNLVDVRPPPVLQLEKLAAQQGIPLLKMQRSVDKARCSMGTGSAVHWEISLLQPVCYACQHIWPPNAQVWQRQVPMVPALCPSPHFSLCEGRLLPRPLLCAAPPVDGRQLQIHPVPRCSASRSKWSGGRFARQ